MHFHTIASITTPVIIIRSVVVLDVSLVLVNTFFVYFVSVYRLFIESM